MDEEATLERLINISKNILSSEGLAGVTHYFEHHEYEMSFEGLVIELYTSKRYPAHFDFTEWKTLGLAFGLDKESIFEENFWDYFINWGNTYSAK